MARLVQRAGKWFSSSLALGTNIVANITDSLPSDMSCYHDRARCPRPPYFNPHGGPITHSSTGSKPDSPVNPLLPRLFLAHGLVSNLRATFREIISYAIRRNTYSHCYEPLSQFVSGNERLPMRLKLLFCTFLLCSRYFLKLQFESCYPPPSPMLSTR